ncbi:MULTISPECIES: MFS transporter [unclassified Paenibacillus]|uniref:MFS transporter n=1 Tax=unclassified Paenibacillus TaxID=185978 RepID=UPI0009A66711|nr:MULTISPECIES: MFS transporter [unclassified Paenibacillus]SLK01608.1 Predicted arabinose efflux permease, MFS family [Paenibacillus sp. RU5A]SOC68762.1 Predicted arabinose efflux permease, MFS family [Paenibacillus sp. RU26A]SOC71187.1 Predicted arabinose efflux permease, MFS family [Paenibacillus sp. RU5M]
MGTLQSPEPELGPNGALAAAESQKMANRALWRNVAYRRILCGYGISVFGDCFNGIAISLWVLQTTGSAKSMAAVQVCNMVVSFLFGSFAGTFADRLDRRTLMLSSDLFRGAMAFIIAVSLFVLHAPFPIVLLMLSLSMFSSLFQAPAFHASVTSLVGREHLQQATGTIHLVDNIARISGLAAAGIAVSAFGGFTAIMITGVTFLLSALCVMLAGRFPDVQRSSMHRGSFVKEWGGSFSYIFSHPLIRSIVILNPLLILFFMSAIMLVQVMAVKVWQANPVQFGLIETCIPLGYMLGSGILIASGNRLKRRGRWVFIGLLVLGPLYMLLANVSSPLVALPLIIAGGAMFACCTMLTQIMMRAEVPDELQGRIYGVLGTITSTAPILGLTVVSVLADQWGAQTVLESLGALLLVVGIIAAAGLKSIRTYR